MSGVKPPILARYRTDSSGRYRRLCDFEATRQGLFDEGGPCEKYGQRDVGDGRTVCRTHDPTRNEQAIMCAAPVHWDKKGRPDRTCGHRARWFVTEEYGGGAYCTQHDPMRPRCENVKRHPHKHADILPALDVYGHPLPDPTTPRADEVLTVGRLRVRLCTPCRKGHRWRQLKLCEGCGAPPLGTVDGRRLCGPCTTLEFPHQAIDVPVHRRPPQCNLCDNTRRLRWAPDPRTPCVCTPEGRALVNGCTDAEVRDILEERTPLAQTRGNASELGNPDP